MVTYTKNVKQYSQKLPPDTMRFLRFIANAYAKVKQATYDRYGGIRSLNKLTPGYTALNEMRHTGLRQELNMPIVYYELAILDAIRAIKMRWGVLRDTLKRLALINGNFSKEDRVYIYTVLKLGNIYSDILNHKEHESPDNVKDLRIDIKRLDNWLRRQTRKHLSPIRVTSNDNFCVSPKAGYSYKNGVMKIAGLEPRKRIEIPLKDERQFKRQLNVLIKEDYIILVAPLTKETSRPKEWNNEIYLHIGNIDALTLSNGHVYGEGLNVLTDGETERLYRKTQNRNKLYDTKRKAETKADFSKVNAILVNNLGTLKYFRQKQKIRVRTEDFINKALNKMFEREKPCRVVITYPVKTNKDKRLAKTTKRKMSRSFQGFIRERLQEKCEERDIELIKIGSKGTGSICSVCGEKGKTTAGNIFYCRSCGYRSTVSLNGARNIEKKYKQ